MTRTKPRRREPVDGSRLDSRAYTWYAIRVPPQKERLAELLLQEQGFATFVPVSKRWEFRNRANKGRWRKREVSRCLMPGYVFVGMSERTPGWERVVCFELVIGIIGHQGRPMPIPHDTVRNEAGEVIRQGLRDLIWWQAGGRFNAPDYQRWQDTRRTFAPGDEVLTPLEDELGRRLRAKVIDIQDREAKVLMDSLLGGPREVWIDQTKLQAAE